MPRRSRSRSLSRERSRSPKRDAYLPCNAKPITESDYFQKSDEFRLWLKEDKRKYFDELSGVRARSYFRKFVKAWNRAKLPKSYYEGIDPLNADASSQTAYKWAFASKKTRADDQALRAARQEVGAATRAKDTGYASHSQSGSGRTLGPTMPSAADMTLANEAAAEYREEERTYKRKRDKLDTKERIEEMVGPREVGREGMLEKKRVKRENDKAFRERGDDGLEADETSLMGIGDSFKDQIVRRDLTRKRKEDERRTAARERMNVHKEKERATMDMFQQLAKQRFG